MKATRRSWPGRSWLGFAAPASRRIAVALVYAVVAFGVVAWVERAPAARVPGSVVEPDTSKPAGVIDQPIMLEATCAIARWTVRVDGRELVASQATPQVWRGTARFSSTAPNELFIDIAASDDTETPAAVRVVVGEGTARRERTWWLDETGTVTQRWSIEGAP